MRTRRAVIILGLILAASLLGFPACKREKSGLADRHVIVIGICGLGAEHFQQAATPNLKRLAREGAMTLRARSVMPSDIMPAWAAAVTGAGPEQNGITSNDWLPGKPGLGPTDKDEAGLFPNIFSLLRRQAPAAETAVFTDWDGFPHIFNPMDIGRVELVKDYRDIFALAIPHILDNRPRLTILNVAHTDDVGHQSGPDSEEFMRLLTEVDAEIGRLIEAVSKTDWGASCTYIVATDHGWFRRSHGGDNPKEMEVPWIIKGPGILRGRMISQPVDLADTAPTIARILGLKTPASWTGRPVAGAFEAEKHLAAANTKTFVPMPKSSLASGLYTEDGEVAFTVDDAGAEIRIVVSGGVSVPDAKALLYEKPLPLSESCVVTAAAFKDGFWSEPTVVRYERVLGIEGVEMALPADRLYTALGPLSLVDGKWGGQDFQDGNWLGMKKKDFEAVVNFGDRRDIRKLGLDVFRNERKTIYLPVSVTFALSADGKTYKEAARLNEKEILKAAEKGIGPIPLTKEIRKTSARFLKIRAVNRGYIPEGSPKEGEKAFLLVDEIIFE